MLEEAKKALIAMVADALHSECTSGLEVNELWQSIYGLFGLIQDYDAANTCITSSLSYFISEYTPVVNPFVASTTTSAESLAVTLEVAVESNPTVPLTIEIACDI